MHELEGEIKLWRYQNQIQEQKMEDLEEDNSGLWKKLEEREQDLKELQGKVVNLEEEVHRVRTKSGSASGRSRTSRAGIDEWLCKARKAIEKIKGTEKTEDEKDKDIDGDEEDISSPNQSPAKQGNGSSLGN